jgi:starch synthase
MSAMASKPDNIEVLPVGCQTDQFTPRDKDDPKIQAVREGLGISPEQLMILTIGGDAASKGAQEVMQALASIQEPMPDWRYVCKVWPQERTEQQNVIDLKLAQDLGIADKIIYATNTISRNFMPYLMGACDIYAAPSRLEGFGMPHVEAGASGKPVIGINAMGLLDTMIHGETALLAGVDRKIVAERSHHSARSPATRKITRSSSIHPAPWTTGRAFPISPTHLRTLMKDPALRQKMGAAGRVRAAERFDYRVVAKRFIEITQPTLGYLLTDKRYETEGPTWQSKRQRSGPGSALT